VEWTVPWLNDDGGDDEDELFDGVFSLSNPTPIRYSFLATAVPPSLFE
jgi:hypothetical protein